MPFTKAKRMLKSKILAVGAVCLAAGCSDDTSRDDADDDGGGSGAGGTSMQAGSAGSEAGSAGNRAGAGGGGGTAGSSAQGGTGAVWDMLPAGDGVRAGELKASCEAQCQRDGTCGFWDANECIRDCSDPRELCQADLAPDACWTAWTAYTSCIATLDCAELNHFYYNASTSDRPCRAEATTLEEICGYIELIASSQCYGPNFTCADGSMSVSTYWVCDGEGDCADRSDEANCPWLTNGPMSSCLPSASIDSVDSAADVAALAGVTCIDGPLYIRSSTLTDLTGLESLTSVQQLEIGGTPPQSFGAAGNPSLVSLHGLENLRGVTHLVIEGNPVLTDISALSGLTFITGNLEIVENATLASLEGLHQIGMAGEITIAENLLLKDLKGLRGLTSADGFELSNNPLVENFEGLENVEYFGAVGLYVFNDDALVDFSGLDKVRSIGADFSVSSNDALTSFAGLEAVENLAWTVRISNNTVLASISELESVTTIRGDVTIEDNPLLPSCDIDKVLSPLSKPCTCSGNDDAATCE
jgi:hypothetical protein